MKLLVPTSMLVVCIPCGIAKGITDTGMKLINHVSASNQVEINKTLRNMSTYIYIHIRT